MAGPPSGDRIIAVGTVLEDRGAGIAHPPFSEFAAHLFDRAARAPTQALAATRLRVAGLDLRLVSEDRGLLDAYAGRFAGTAGHSHTASSGRLDVALHGLAALRLPSMPSWEPPAGETGADARRDDGFLSVSGGGYDASYQAAPPVWTLFDRASGRALQLAGQADALPPWDIGAPCRLPIHHALRRSGWRLAHAGTLGRDGTGVLIAGLGGAGKSGTVLAGALDGLTTVGDDYVALGLEADRVVARAVYSHVKQDAAGIDRQGLGDQLGPGDRPNWQGKYELPLAAIAPGALVEALSIRAVVLPRRGPGEGTGWRRCGALEAMRALGLSSLTQLPETLREGFADYARLLRRLPAFRLDLGSAPAGVAEAVSRLIEAVR
ncbi:MAG: hypothetical protein RLO50_18200 [Azospirillaceae bacterium]